ncbi:cytosolic carboxypeptidase 2-like [Watersipora subatra]|uniref:cytosolic carboxypeptidase 2-like n=1 Tax=Watersipora subatra TaxID=2589382 RepID=UPI00355B6607
MPSYKAQNGVPYPPSSYSTNPYDDFMKKHLSHYGYYTGRNADYNKKSFLFNDFNKTHGYELSSSSSEDEKASEGNDQKSLQLEYRYEAGRLVSRLREPRQLFAITNPSLGPQQLPRWPAELQVAIEGLQHSFNSPSVKEPFYLRTGSEFQPQLVSQEEGRTVFLLRNHTSPFFLHSRVGGSRDEAHSVTEGLTGPDDKTLLFESRFESGNLAKAVQTGPFTYELWLRNDLYTSKHTQWFYFQIKNTRKGQKYRFTICNFMKSSSLYNDGMKPCYYSEKDERSMGLGWRRKGEDISYYKSNYTYVNGKSMRPYYALTFTQTFTENDDTVYLAHCYPYTYSDLQGYLKDIVDDEHKSKLCKLRVLARSLAGNLVYLLSITSPSEETQQPRLVKKAVVVTARVHPGETNGSWMMKGLLDYILGDSEDAKLLRDTFVFKIVPMLNPDGVIVGNYRCSLAGRDLNRNYKSQLNDSYPTIMAAKSMIKKLSAEREIVVYCDLHGHSRKQNVFIYGCENRANRSKRLHERVFPAMLSKNCPEKFVFEECTFKVQKGKEGTGRIVMWNMGITNSFTMEATFCGSAVGSSKSFHFNIRDFESMGFHFCDTLLDYCDPDKTKYLMIMSELEATLKNQILNKFARLGKTNVMLNGKQLDLSDPELDIDELLAAGVDLSEDDGGSDSSVSDGPPINIAYIQSKAAQKKKKLSRKDRDKLKNAANAATEQLSSKVSHPPTSSCFKAGQSTRVCSARDRHEKCHHNHSGKDRTPVRRCLSAKHSNDTSSGSSERTVPYRDNIEQSVKLTQFQQEEDDRVDDSNQRAYLASIVKGATTSTTNSSSNPLTAVTGHLRYSTSNINRPLAMNLDELTENQPECSVSAQYLLTRVKCPETSIENRENEQEYSSLVNSASKERQYPYPITNGMTAYNMPKVGAPRARGSGSSRRHQQDANSQDNKPHMMQPKQQSLKQVDISSPLDRAVIKQHPLPFEKISKPGQGALEARPVSTPHYSKRPERQKTANRVPQHAEKGMEPEKLHLQFDEFGEIPDFRRSIHSDLHAADFISTNGRREAARKYLEKVVKETDNDIEKLRKELTELNAENSRHNRNSILDLAARQRQLATSRKGKHSTSPDMKSLQNLYSEVKYDSTGMLSKWGDSQPTSLNTRRQQPNGNKELANIASKGMAHTSHYPVPSAPKASRRVQVQTVPSVFIRHTRYP